MSSTKTSFFRLRDEIDIILFFLIFVSNFDFFGVNDKDESESESEEEEDDDDDKCNDDCNSPVDRVEFSVLGGDIFL